jgi:uncharacterized RDD family membrane protein YckC
MPCANHPEVLAGLAVCVRCHRRFCGDCIIRLRGKASCARCKPYILRAVRSGMARGPRLASRGARLGARFLDNLFTTVPLVVVLIALARCGLILADPGVLLICSFAVILAVGIYEAGMLTWRGQTMGKIALGIRVTGPKGAPINSGQAWGRTIARVGFSLVHLWFFDAIFILSGSRACLHDRMAGTMVVVGAARPTRGVTAQWRARPARTATRAVTRTGLRRR